MSRLAAKAKFSLKRKLLVMLKRFIRAIRLALYNPELAALSEEAKRESDVLHNSDPTTRNEEDRRKADRHIVMRLSSGNIRLQRGEYVTKEDLDKQYERVKALNFDDE